MYKYCLFFLCLITLSCSNDNDEGTAVTLPNESSVADQIFVLVNQHRQNEGLPALEKNSTAESLAIDHTNYMIAQGVISHDDIEIRGNELTDKENAVAVAENVASSYPTAEAVMTGWLNSSGHKQNIEGNYTHIGIAAVKDENGTYYYTQLFYR